MRAGMNLEATSPTGDGLLKTCGSLRCGSRVILNKGKQKPTGGFNEVKCAFLDCLATGRNCGCKGDAFFLQIGSSCYCGVVVMFQHFTGPMVAKFGC